MKYQNRLPGFGAEVVLEKAAGHFVKIYTWWDNTAGIIPAEARPPEKVICTKYCKDCEGCNWYCCQAVPQPPPKSQ